jgi:trimeric autotransporter adhesin
MIDNKIAATKAGNALAPPDKGNGPTPAGNSMHSTSDDSTDEKGPGTSGDIKEGEQVESPADLKSTAVLPPNDAHPTQEPAQQLKNTTSVLDLKNSTAQAPSAQANSTIGNKNGSSPGQNLSQIAPTLNQTINKPSDSNPQSNSTQLTTKVDNSAPGSNVTAAPNNNATAPGANRTAPGTNDTASEENVTTPEASNSTDAASGGEEPASTTTMAKTTTPTTTTTEEPEVIPEDPPEVELVTDDPSVVWIYLSNSCNIS